MSTFTVKKIKDKYMLELLPSPSSSYTLFFYFISFILLSIISYIFLYFAPNFIKSFAIALLPLALFVFNFKINIWNTFGKETIVIDQVKVVSTLDYKYIYKTRTTEHFLGGGEIRFISSKDGSESGLNDLISEDHKRSKFRIILKDDGKKIYQSSNFLNYEELKTLKETLIIS